MNLRMKTWLMACCVLLFGSATASAQVIFICDTAAARGAVGSCQVANPEFPNGAPDCFHCVNSLIIGQVGHCVADDTFCAGIAGGTGPNDCRIAVCTDVSTFTQPTGCDYVIDPSPTPIPQCFQCNDSTAPFANHCPNGACEPGQGETTATCPEDCVVPGMTPTPLPTQADMTDACTPSVPAITFDGPPFNVSGSLDCEDGNVCTGDSCSGGSCVHTNLGCSHDVSDLCCPGSCHAPAAGTLCGNDLNCDTDCKPQIPCPLPTPIPTPTPIALKCIEGSGFGSEKSGLPTCKGFSCSLNPVAESAPGFGLMMLVVAGMGYGAYRRLRRNEG